MVIWKKRWPLERSQGFSNFIPGDAVFDNRWPIYKEDPKHLSLMVIKWKMWPFKCSQDFLFLVFVTYLPKMTHIWKIKIIPMFAGVWMKMWPLEFSKCKFKQTTVDWRRTSIDQNNPSLGSACSGELKTDNMNRLLWF